MKPKLCPCSAPAEWWAEKPAGKPWRVLWDSERPGPWCLHCAQAYVQARHEELPATSGQLTLL